MPTHNDYVRSVSSRRPPFVSAGDDGVLDVGRTRHAACVHRAHRLCAHRGGALTARSSPVARRYEREVVGRRHRRAACGPEGHTDLGARRASAPTAPPWPARRTMASLACGALEIEALVSCGDDVQAWTGRTRCWSRAVDGRSFGLVRGFGHHRRGAVGHKPGGQPGRADDRRWDQHGRCAAVGSAR